MPAQPETLIERMPPFPENVGWLRANSRALPPSPHPDMADILVSSPDSMLADHRDCLVARGPGDGIARDAVGKWWLYRNAPGVEGGQGMREEYWDKFAMPHLIMSHSGHCWRVRKCVLSELFTVVEVAAK